MPTDVPEDLVAAIAKARAYVAAMEEGHWREDASSDLEGWIEEWDLFKGLPSVDESDPELALMRPVLVNLPAETLGEICLVGAPKLRELAIEIREIQAARERRWNARMAKRDAQAAARAEAWRADGSPRTPKGLEDFFFADDLRALGNDTIADEVDKAETVEEVAEVRAKYAWFLEGLDEDDR